MAQDRMTHQALLNQLDAALRRAQALASSTPAGLTITRALLDRKFAGQASVLASLDVLGAAAVSAIIDDGRAALAAALDPSGPRFPRRHGWGEEGRPVLMVSSGAWLPRVLAHSQVAARPSY